MDPKDKEVLKNNLPLFVRTVDALEILPYLPCLTELSKEKIENAYFGAMGSRSRAATTLYDRLIRRPEGFKQLVGALRKSEINNTVLADQLDPPRPDRGGVAATGTSTLYSRQPSASAQCLPRNPTLSPRTGDIEGSDRADVGQRAYTLDTSWNELPIAVHNSLRKMDRHGAVSGPDDLAEIAELTYDEYEYLKERAGEGKSLIIEIITKWNEKQGPITLKDVYRALAEMERVDILTEIENKTKVKAPNELHITTERVEGQPQDDLLTNDQPQVDNVERQEEEQNVENDNDIVSDTSDGTMIPVQRIQTMQQDVNRKYIEISSSPIQPSNTVETNHGHSYTTDSNGLQYSDSRLPQSGWPNADKTQTKTPVSTNLPNLSTEPGASAIGLPTGNLPKADKTSPTASSASFPMYAVNTDTSVRDNTAGPLDNDDTRGEDIIAGYRYSSAFQDIRYPGPLPSKAIPGTTYNEGESISANDNEHIVKNGTKKQQPEGMFLETKLPPVELKEQLEDQASSINDDQTSSIRMKGAQSLSMKEDKTILANNINCDRSKVMASKTIGDLTSTDPGIGGNATAASMTGQSPDCGDDTSNAGFLSGRESVEVSDEDNADEETTYLATDEGAPSAKEDRCEGHLDFSLEDLNEKRLAGERDMDYSQEMQSIEKKSLKKIPCEYLANDADSNDDNVHTNEAGAIGVEDCTFDDTNNSAQSVGLMNEAICNEGQGPQNVLTAPISEQQQQSNTMTGEEAGVVRQELDNKEFHCNIQMKNEHKPDNNLSLSTRVFNRETCKQTILRAFQNYYDNMSSFYQ